jgi:hypothetical protein
MPSFKYIIVNKENKQLTGEVDAPSEEIARKDLQALGFSIVSIEEKKKEDKDEAGVIFEFKGIDSQNRKITGTIKSESRYQAFKRLITEYELDVHYVVQSNLQPKEKTKQIEEGVKDLMKNYREEIKKNTNLFHEKKLKQIDRNFEKEKALVMRQVDFVLSKVGESIETFAKELNADDKQKIKDYVNKILRLKNTTNLDYLKKSTEELLKFLQKAEIFVNKKSNVKSKLKLYAESQDMIDHLDKGKDFGVYQDLEEQILRWQSEHIKGKKKNEISIINKVKSVYYALLLKIIHQPEEIREINRQLDYLNRELKQYYNVYLKSKDQTYKKEAIKSIKRLKERKISLKNKIKELKKEEIRRNKEEGELNFFEKIIEGINGITGWLLFFYLVFYFISGIIINKNIIFEFYEIPSIFYLFQSGLIKYILPIVFLLHITTSIKLYFFKKNIIADLILFPALALVSLIVVFNF